LHDQSGVSLDVYRVTHEIASTLWWVAVKVIGNCRGHDAALEKFDARPVVDGHMRPRTKVRWTFEVLEVRALPRKVVVTKHGGSVRQHFVEGIAGVEIEW
jgi:hypothetical protein